MTQRAVFEKIAMDGFRTTKVESIGICNSGQRLFVGTNDGALIAYECQTSLSSYSKFNCHIFSTIKSQHKEKKSVSNLTVVEGWGIIIGIVDGIITAFDINSFYVKATVPDTKGCHVFSVHEYNGVMAVANKRKVSIYRWSSPSTASSTSASAISSGFILHKEISNLSELPKNVTCVSNGYVVGLKRSYEIYDLVSLNPTKILDVDKDQRMVCLEIPVNELRSTSIILSHGNQGLVYDLFKMPVSPTTAIFPTRLEWSSLPISAHYMVPFILTLLQDCIEVHEVGYFTFLQRIPLPVSSASLSSFASSSTPSFSFTSCEIDSSVGLEHAYISTGDQVVVLRMTPLSTQISSLLEASKFEDAINLNILSVNNPQIRDIDVAGVYEKYASYLFYKGDFDNAIVNYIKAESSPQKVLPLFPDLVPVVFHGYLGISQQSSSKGSTQSKSGIISGSNTSTRMIGIVLTRAASAVSQYCEYYRKKMKNQVEVADKYRTASMTAASALENLENLVVSDWEDVLRLAEVVDTVYLCALINSSPSRRSAVVDLLSNMSPVNRCHMESSTTMIASQGNTYSEALLWLYRSHNEHKRVIVALTEDRCVGLGAWTKDQFYHWTADYLRWLWFSEDSTLPSLVLNALKPVLDYDPTLGLSVLTQRPSNTEISMSMKSKTILSAGGRGTEIQEILNYLETVNIKPPMSAVSTTSSQTNQKRSSVSGNSTGNSNSNNTNPYISNADAIVHRLPLVNGKALSLTYLEWRVSNCLVPSMVHNDYAMMLINGLPNDVTVEHNSISLDIKPADSERLVLYKIYRKKLQTFLQTSSEYNAEKLLKILPPQYLHEYALILSKLKRHEEVLKVYVTQVKDMNLAESYCDNIFRKLWSGKTVKGTTSTINPNRSQTTHSSTNDESIYLTLIKVLLSDTSDGSTSNNNIDQSSDTSSTSDRSYRKTATIVNQDLIIRLAEKYFDRLDPIEFLKELPSSISLASLAKYLNIVMEFSTTQKRNLQVSRYRCL